MRNLLLLLFVASMTICGMVAYVGEYPVAKSDARMVLDDRNIVPEELGLSFSGCRARLWAFHFRGVQGDKHVSGLVCLGGIQGSEVIMENAPGR